MMFRVQFSPTSSQCLLSISGDTIQQRNINGFQIISTYNGSNIALSPYGSQFVSKQGDDIVVQNIDSGVIVAKFHAACTVSQFCFSPNGRLAALINSSNIHIWDITGSNPHFIELLVEKTNQISSLIPPCDDQLFAAASQLCFSPDGRLVALIDGSNIHIWDITSPNPHLIETLVEHSNHILSLIFSSPSSFISLCYDQSVKFWEIDITTADPTITDQEPTHHGRLLLTFISLQQKDGIAVSGDCHRVERTWDLTTGLCTLSLQTPVPDPWGDARQIKNRLIIVSYQDGRINMWDTDKGFQIVDGPGDDTCIDNLKISEDGSKVFCLGEISIYALCVSTGEVVGMVNFAGPIPDETLTVDGSQAWVNLYRSEPLGWDFGIQGSSPVQLSYVPSVLHPSSTKEWDAELSRIKDKVTGKVVLQLSGMSGRRPLRAEWDGQYLVACFRPGKVLILDFGHILC